MSMKKEITAGTIAGVLSAVIVIALGIIWTPIGSLLWRLGTSIWSLVANFVVWLQSPVWMPRWITYLLVVYVTIRLGKVITSKFSLKVPADPEGPTIDEFTEMEFRNLKWKWTWKGHTISDLSCFCPNCDRHMRYTEDRIRVYQRSIEILCSNCPSVRQEYAGNFSEFENDARLEIDHAIRTGEWQKWVNRKRHITEHPNASP